MERKRVMSLNPPPRSRLLLPAFLPPSASAVRDSLLSVQPWPERAAFAFSSQGQISTPGSGSQLRGKAADPANLGFNVGNGSKGGNNGKRTVVAKKGKKDDGDKAKAKRGNNDNGSKEKNKTCAGIPGPAMPGATPGSRFATASPSRDATDLYSRLTSMSIEMHARSRTSAVVRTCTIFYPTIFYLKCKPISFYPYHF